MNSDDEPGQAADQRALPIVQEVDHGRHYDLFLVHERLIVKDFRLPLP